MNNIHLVGTVRKGLLGQIIHNADTDLLEEFETPAERDLRWANDIQSMAVELKSAQASLAGIQSMAAELKTSNDELANARLELVNVRTALGKYNSPTLSLSWLVQTLVEGHGNELQAKENYKDDLVAAEKKIEILQSNCKPLTENEIAKISYKFSLQDFDCFKGKVEYVRAIEAAHGIVPDA